MSLVADALQPSFLPGIFSVTGNLERRTIADALTEPRAAYRLALDDSKRSLLFDFGEPTFIVTATASDCSRLAVSAFQSLVSIQQETLERDLLPWAFVKLYYASFYAGHTLTRLLGMACSYFEGRHITRIEAQRQAYGIDPEFRIEAGLYRCSLNGPATQLSCQRIGGSHETFWSEFGDHIRHVTGAVLDAGLVAADAQLVFGQLQAFDQLLRRHGSPSWLSTLRNDVQYKHQYAVWFPCEVGRRDRENLARIIAQWRSDPMTIDLNAQRFGRLGEFATACTFTMALCRTLILRIVERAPRRPRSFLDFGPVGFLNQVQMAN
jgi:hypothetical protein